MGADLLSDINCCRHSRLHGHIGGVSRRRALPVLRLRRDLPGAADTGAHDLQGVAVIANPTTALSFGDGAQAPDPRSAIPHPGSIRPAIGPRFARTRWHRPGMT